MEKKKIITGHGKID